MAKKGKDPPVIAFVWLPKIKTLVKPEPEQTVFFKGFDTILERYKDVDAEAEVEACRKNMADAWDKLVAPGSPLTPSEGFSRAKTFEVATNAAATALSVAMIAAEACSLGQLDYSLMSIFQIPAVKAALDTAVSLMASRLDASIVRAARYQMQYTHMPTIIPEDVLVDLHAKDLISDTVFQAYMRYHGYTEARSALMARSAYRFPGLGEILDLRRRGVLTDDGAVDWLKLNRIPEATAKALLTLKDEIPPAADIITGVVREAHVPEMVVKAPKIFSDWMLKKGYSQFWSDWYWTMHFLPMALRQAYENLWRGLWDKKQFMDFLHIADIHPTWREDIYNVAFRPPGMREMGYGYDVGVYTEKDIAMYRRWDGLSPEDAAKAAKSMVAYRTEAEREAVRREHLHLFALGKETIEQFEAHLKRLGTAPAAIPLWLERAELEKDRRTKEPAMPEQRTVSSSEALYAYQAGLRPEAWTRERLADLGWTPERIDLALERVEVLDTGVDEANRIRTLLLEKAREGFVKGPELKDWLVRLGFSANVIDLSLAYSYLSQDWDDVKEQASEWWRLAKAGKITPEAYAAEARKLGMTEERITSKQTLLRKLAEIRAAEEAAKAK